MVPGRIASIVRTASSPAAELTSAIVTCAPSRAKARAHARPMTSAPPVRITTLLSKAGMTGIARVTRRAAALKGYARGCSLVLMATQAPAVHGRPAHALTPADQRAAYEHDGYLVFPELLDA